MFEITFESWNARLEILWDRNLSIKLAREREREREREFWNDLSSSLLLTPITSDQKFQITFASSILQSIVEDGASVETDVNRQTHILSLILL